MFNPDELEGADRTLFDNGREFGELTAIGLRSPSGELTKLSELAQCSNQIKGKLADGVSPKEIMQDVMLINLEELAKGDPTCIDDRCWAHGFLQGIIDASDRQAKATPGS